jgi:hypothetical protein
MVAGALRILENAAPAAQTFETVIWLTPGVAKPSYACSGTGSAAMETTKVEVVMSAEGITPEASRHKRRTRGPDGIETGIR